MSNLGPQRQKASFSGLLQVPGGITSALQTVQDGDGNPTGLQLSSTAISVTGFVSNTAQNIYGGTAGSVPYQSAPGATSFVTAGTTGQLLKSNGILAPSFVTVDSDYVGALASSGGTMSGAINMGNNLVTNLATPVSSTDAATKAYVDSVAVGLQAKTPCVAASTANIASLAGLLTVDGVTLTTGQRVLVKNQATAANNGIYVADSSAWSRATDADSWNELIGAYVYISGGTTQSQTGWVCNVAAGGTINVTAITWVQFSSVSTYSAGNGLSLVGTTFSISAPVSVANGGTGATTLTGVVYGNGSSAMTAATGSQIATAIGSNAVQTATNLAGGTAGGMPYQTASGNTGFASAGSSGQVLISGGTLAPSFVTNLPNTVKGIASRSGSAISNCIARPVTDFFGDTVSILDFGGVADFNSGTNSGTDNTSAINAALSAGAKKIYFPSGNYLIAGAVNALSGGQWIVGDGPNSSVFWCGDGFDVFTMNSNFCRISSVGFQSRNNSNRTSGSYVRIDGSVSCRDTYVDHFYMDKGYYGVNITGANCVQNVVKDGQIRNLTPSSGIGIVIQGGSDTHIHNMLIDTDNDANQCSSGVTITDTGGIFMSDCDIVSTGTGLNLVPAGSQRVQWLSINNCDFDTCAQYGLNVAPTSGGQVNGCTFNACWFASNGISTTGPSRIGIGARLDQGSIAGGALVSGINFVACRFFNNNAQGFYVNCYGVYGSNPFGIEWVSLNGCMFSGNSLGNAYPSASSVADLQISPVAAGAGGVTVNGCMFGNMGGLTSWPKAGILIDATANYVIVTSNMVARFNGSLLPGIVNNSAGTGIIIANNFAP